MAIKKEQPAVTQGQPVPQNEPVQHVPGQVEIPAVTPELKKAQDAAIKKEIPAQGNNIASVEDRAFADTPNPNVQKPVAKVSVSPKDEVAK